MAERIGEVLGERLQAQAAALRAAADALRPLLAVRGEDAETVLHDFRVWTRRLRSALQAARKVFGKYHSEQISDVLGKLVELTHPARDAEVLALKLRKAELNTECGPAVAQLLECWDEESARSRQQLAAALETGALDMPLAWIEALVALPIKPGRNGSARKVARAAVEKAAEPFVEGLEDFPKITKGAAALHALRLDAKRLRYLIDLYEPWLQRRQRKLEPLARELQTELGELRDFDLLLARIRQATLEPAAARASVLAWAEAARGAQAARLLERVEAIQIGVEVLNKKSAGS